MINFQLAGRLGNQLFQWATALKIQENDGNIRLFYDDYHQSSPTSIVSDLVEGKIQIKKNNLLGRLLQVEDKFFHESRIIKSLIHTESDAYSALSTIPKRTKVLRGYFQNWQNVFESEKEIYFELNRVTERILNSSTKVSNLRVELGNFNVIHIRIGDYRNSKFGVLSPDFYSSVLRNLTGPVAIFTDQSMLPEEYSQVIKPDYIFTPNDFDSDETFALMSCGNRLVIANSTFSWWAGFLAIQHSREVLVPDPWLKESHVGKALIYPSMIKIESSFI